MKEVTKVTAAMFKEHVNGTCNALFHPQSKAERLNGNIQEIQTVGEGIENLKSSALLFFLQILNLYHTALFTGKCQPTLHH